MNIPAIETLELIGANSFENNLRNFIGQDVGHTNEAGLTLAVGGFYLSVEELIEIYLEMVILERIASSDFSFKNPHMLQPT